MSLRHWSWLLIITWVGAFFRLYHLADFKANVDHAYPTAQAMRWLMEGHWPALGQYTSVLFNNPSGMSYLMTISWVMSGTQWGSHYFVALVNVLVIPLTYVLMRRFNATETALMAALIMAINPWLVHYSRGAWVQGLLPFWVTLTFVLLVWGLFRRPRWLAGAGIALAGLTQMYLLAFFSVAQFGAVLLVNFKRIAWRPLISGLVIFVTTTGLYLAFIVADWRNQSVKLETLIQNSGDKSLLVQLNAIEHATRFVTGADYEVEWANDGPVSYGWRRPLAQGVSLFLFGVLAFGIGRASWRIITHKTDAKFWGAVLIWWALPAFALSMVPFPVHIIYLMLTVPAGACLIAPLLAGFLRWRVIAFLGVMCLTLNTFFSVQVATSLVAQHPGATNLDELSLRASRPFRDDLTPLIDTFGLEEIYVNLSSETLSVKTGRLVQANSLFQLPELQIFTLDTPSVYVRLQKQQPPNFLPLATRYKLMAYPGSDYLAIDVVPAYTRYQLSELPQEKVEWPTAEGLTLVGYDTLPQKKGIRVYWVVDGLADARNDWLFSPYAHLYNQAGERVANVSAPGLAGYFYRIGDVYLSEIKWPELSAGEYRLVLGLYDGVHGGLNSTFLPPAAEPRPEYTAPLTLP